MKKKIDPAAGWIIFTLKFKEGDARAEAAGQPQIDQGPGRVMFDDPGESGRVVGVVPLVRRQNQLRQSVRDARVQQERLVGVVEGQQGHRLDDEAEELRVQSVVQGLDHHAQLGLLHELVPGQGRRAGHVEQEPGAEDLQAVVAALADAQAGRAAEAAALVLVLANHHPSVQSDGVQHQTQHRPGVDLVRQQTGHPVVGTVGTGTGLYARVHLLGATTAGRLLLLDHFLPVGITFARRFLRSQKGRRGLRRAGTSQFIFVCFPGPFRPLITEAVVLLLLLLLLPGRGGGGSCCCVGRAGHGDVDDFVNEDQPGELDTVRAGQKLDAHLK